MTNKITPDATKQTQPQRRSRWEYRLGFRPNRQNSVTRISSPAIANTLDSQVVPGLYSIVELVDGSESETLATRSSSGTHKSLMDQADCVPSTDDEKAQTPSRERIVELSKKAADQPSVDS